MLSSSTDPNLTVFGVINTFDRIVFLNRFHCNAHSYGENRGYYMAAWGYEFYLRVLKVSLASERKRTSKRYLPSNVLFILWILMKFLHKTQLFLEGSSLVIG